MVNRNIRVVTTAGTLSTAELLAAVGRTNGQSLLQVFAVSKRFCCGVTETNVMAL